MAESIDRRADHMSRIWRYSLVHDTGLAPCVDQNILTLTCCKPDIRKAACKGDWVIGFVSATVRRGLVAWVGKVSEIMTLGEYGSRFAKRTDALYRLHGYDADGSELLHNLHRKYHPDDQSQATDRRGRNALIFDPFWYWGRNAVAAPPDIAEWWDYHIGQSAPDRRPRKLPA